MGRAWVRNLIILYINEELEIHHTNVFCMSLFLTWALLNFRDVAAIGKVFSPGGAGVLFLIVYIIHLM